jgi:Zinc carboxypeptidase
MQHTTTSMRSARAWPIALALAVSAASAQPLAVPAVASAPAAVESAAVAARFPDPAVSYRTPAFEPGHAGMTSNDELHALMRGLVRDADANGAGDATAIRLIALGSSQTGVPIEALHFSREPVPLAATGTTAVMPRPVVLLVGQQHGDEPAGSEALIAVAQALAHGALAPLLERIDVLVLPRANPDGALAETRVTAGGIDMNRDHLLLRTPEAQALAQLARDFNPAVVVDAHEYAALGRQLQKFGAVPRFDALIQYAMVANLPEFVTRASEEWFRRPLLQSLKAQGLTTEWYHTSSADTVDKKVSMGGVQPDNGRNVYGLRNAVSFLIETRGIGLGTAHLQRRVHTHVTAITSVLKSAAARADDLRKLRRFVDADVTSKACKGEAIVEAAATPSEYTLLMLDPKTGADKPVDVAWDSALALRTLKRRARPCGYWLGADQADAVARLRGLGVQVQQLDEGGAVRGEAYAEKAREVGARADVRGTVADGGSVLRVQVDLLPATLEIGAGSYYVGLDQPLANLVIAALEPDTPNSFVAHGIVSGVQAQARVLIVRPELKMTALP